jgi:hypothetical protein
MLNLYLLSQNQNNKYDTCDSMVVAAESEDQAKQINPCGVNYNTNPRGWGSYDWAKNPKDVNVQFLGTAAPNIKPGVILSSFNAG